MEDLLGQPGETLVGKTRADVLPKDRAEEHDANDRVVIQSRAPATFAEEYDGQDSHHVYLSTRFPLFDDDDEIASVCCISMDITATRRVEAELAAANTRLEGVVRQTASIVGRIVEARDPYTQGHENRVAELATMIAIEMGLPDDEVEGIEVAGLLHDIGKMGVPAEILSKPGGLSKEQYALVQCHPTDGHEILRGIDFPWPVAEAVLQHHERMDGSGYPQGLHGDEISTMSRILAVADVVEAITSHRPYRPALGIEAAMAEINEHPEKYDQDVAAALLRVRQSGRIPL
jgi:putative nucleotidyltransferase with HDIG domain